MIDFNDVRDAPEPSKEAKRDEIRAELLARLDSVLFTALPRG